jgi:hypothetical protein
MVNTFSLIGIFRFIIRKTCYIIRHACKKIKKYILDAQISQLGKFVF